MQKKTDKILDQFDESPQKRWFEHWSIVFLPFIIFIFGLIFRIQHWPYSRILIAIGLCALFIRNIIFFFSKPRTFSDWAYFLGKIFLLTTLILHFGFYQYSITTLIAGLFAFTIGLVVYWLSKDRSNHESEENLEDDF